MGLNVNSEFHGIKIPNAYAALTDETITLRRDDMSFAVAFSVSKWHAPFKVIGYSSPYEINGPSPFDQAYAYLKTLPEFEGAIDS